MFLSLLLACTPDTVTLRGTVVDVWGAPIAAASVVIEGQVERFPADAEGAFTIPTERASSWRLLAGKQGYIRDIETVAGPAAGDPAPIRFELYPKPERPGFYAVGAAAYGHLPARRIVVEATGATVRTGLAAGPREALEPGVRRFVFTSTLRSSELGSLGLRLTRLAEPPAPPTKPGRTPPKTPPPPPLWTASADVDIEVTALPSPDDYLVTTAPLDPGVYAFHSRDALTLTDAAAVEALPKELLLAHVFEIPTG